MNNLDQRPMSDLGQRLRDLYDAAAPPVRIEDIVAEQPSTAHRTRLRVIGVVSAAALAVVLLLVLAVVPGGSAHVPVIEQPPTIEPEPTMTAGAGSTDASFDADDDPSHDVLPGQPLAAGPEPATRPAPGPSASRPPRATGRAPTGSIAYASGGEIRIVDVSDGSTRTIASGIHPRWSPGGQRISFVNPDTRALWTVRTDGTQLTQVTDELTDVIEGAPFSPDGSRLVYVGDRGCPPDTVNDIPLVCEEGSDRGLWTVGVDGSELTRLISGSVANPTWSPDGERITYIEAAVVHTIAADGTDRQRVYEQSSGFAHLPRFSPDGTRLAFLVLQDGPPMNAETCKGPSMELWTVNADGSQARSLGAGPYWSYYGGNMPIHEGRAPEWSPDGTSITFADVFNIWVADADTGVTRAILPTQGGADCQPPDADAAPTWSPDGEFIVAFSRLPRSGADGLITVRANGTHAQLLVAGPAEYANWRQ